MANGTLDDFAELYRSMTSDFQKFDGKNGEKIEADLSKVLGRNTQQLVKRLQTRLEALRTHQGDYAGDFNARVAALQGQIDQLQAKPPDDTPPLAGPNGPGAGGVPQPHVIVAETPAHAPEPRPRRKRRKRGEGENG